MLRPSMGLHKQPLVRASYSLQRRLLYGSHTAHVDIHVSMVVALLVPPGMGAWCAHGQVRSKLDMTVVGRKGMQKGKGGGGGDVQQDSY